MRPSFSPHKSLHRRCDEALAFHRKNYPRRLPTVVVSTMRGSLIFAAIVAAVVWDNLYNHSRWANSLAAALLHALRIAGLS
jgi:hypothetical protein